MSYYWVNLSDIIAMPKERFTALGEWLSSQGFQLAIAIDNRAAPLDSEFEKDLAEEAQAQGVNVDDLTRMKRQSGGGI